MLHLEGVIVRWLEVKMIKFNGKNTSLGSLIQAIFSSDLECSKAFNLKVNHLSIAMTTTKTTATTRTTTTTTTTTTSTTIRFSDNPVPANSVGHELVSWETFSGSDFNWTGKNRRHLNCILAGIFLQRDTKFDGLRHRCYKNYRTPCFKFVITDQFYGIL